MKKGQGNKIIACWRKHREIFNYEKHSFFTLQLNTAYSMWQYINIKGPYISRFSSPNYSFVIYKLWKSLLQFNFLYVCVTLHIISKSRSSINRLPQAIFNTIVTAFCMYQLRFACHIKHAFKTHCAQEVIRPPTVGRYSLCRTE
jgi:hypothetical protein